MQGWFQILIFSAVLIAIVPLLGGYMARVFTYERALAAELEGLRQVADRLLRGLVARAVPDPAHAKLHPFNPGVPLGRGTSASTPTSSFVTNTNWQYYARRDDAHGASSR